MDYTFPEHTNLAKGADEDKLLHLSRDCVDEFNADLDSRSEWESMLESWTRLFYMKDIPLNPPWEGSSTESIPMLVEACNQFHARSYGALFPGRQVVSAVATGVKVDEGIRDRLDRVSKHMSYQLIHKDRNYKTDKDRLLLACPLQGTMFTKTYYDPYKERNCVHNVRPIDLVVPYGVGPRNIEDLPRKTEIIRMPYHRAKYLYKTGYFSEMPTACDYTKVVSPVDQFIDEVTGMAEAYDQKDYVQILEQHRFLDMDGDSIEEPYIVWIDATSHKILRITIRYDTNETGTPTNNKEPIEYYTDYPFIANPDGFYGLGYGMLLGPINTAANKLLRQVIDAGTLQNSGNMSGFIDRRLGVAGKLVNLVLGKFIKTESGMEDISKGIYQFKFPGPSNVLNDVLRSLTLRGDRLAMVTETITGQAERVMQPTTVMALIEQANIIFSAAQTRMIEAWSRELDKLYYLNGKYMNEYESFMFATTGGQSEIMQVSRADYAPDMRIVPIADPKMSTKKERLAQSDAEFQTALQCPFITQSFPHLWQVFKRRFEAIGCSDVEAILPGVEQMMLQQAMASEGIAGGASMPMEGAMGGGAAQSEQQPTPGGAQTGSQTS